MDQKGGNTLDYVRGRLATGFSELRTGLSVSPRGRSLRPLLFPVMLNSSMTPMGMHAMVGFSQSGEMVVTHLGFE